MFSAFGIDHGEFSKGLTEASTKNLVRLARKPSKKGEWAAARLNAASEGSAGNVKAGQHWGQIRHGIYPKIEGKSKGNPVGMRGSMSERRTRLKNLKQQSRAPMGNSRRRAQGTVIASDYSRSSANTGGATGSHGRVARAGI
jgi:hypothetical protein